MTSQRDHDYIEYVTMRLPALRRLALLLGQDLHRADDLVQQAVIKVYLHWPKASGRPDANLHGEPVPEPCPPARRQPGGLDDQAARLRRSDINSGG
jgi:hypothetical protein